MNKPFLLFGIALALLIGRGYYCLPTRVTATSAQAVQKEVLSQLLNEGKNCLCSERRVSYRTSDRVSDQRGHMIYYSMEDKTLRVETDPGSGWAFGWDDVDIALIRQVLQEGGQFSLFTKYRPDSKHKPSWQTESF